MSKRRSSISPILKEYIEYFIKEIIPVTAGILIALSIGNWNQNKKDQKYIKEILNITNAELDETLDDIHRVIPLQQSLVDSLDFYADDKEISLRNIVSKAEGFYIANIKDNAWKALSVSKIELIDYRLISAFSNLQEQKELLKTKSTNISNFLYQNLYDAGRDKKEAFKLMILDAMTTEKAARQSIEEVKKRKML